MVILVPSEIFTLHDFQKPAITNRPNPSVIRIHLDSETIEKGTPFDLSPIKFFPNVEELFLDLPSPEELDLKPLIGMDNLWCVSIHLFQSELTLDVSPLSYLINLIDIGLTAYNLVNLHTLANNLKLERLRLGFDLDYVSNWNEWAVVNRPHIYGRFTNYINLKIKEGEIRSPVTKIDLSFMKELRELKEFYLCNSNIDTFELTNFNSLEKIYISSNKLKNLDLKPLEECFTLKVLDLDDNKLEKINLEPLRNLKQLQRLDLSNNELVKIDLEPLKELSNIEEINISNNKIRGLDLKTVRKYKWGNKLITL